MCTEKQRHRVREREKQIEKTARNYKETQKDNDAAVWVCVWFMEHNRTLTITNTKQDANSIYQQIYSLVNDITLYSMSLAQKHPAQKQTNKRADPRAFVDIVPRCRISLVCSLSLSLYVYILNIFFMLMMSTRDKNYFTTSTEFVAVVVVVAHNVYEMCLYCVFCGG